MEYSVKVSHVSKVVGNKKILDDICFNVKKGSIIGLVGPNGAGKSTLLKVMSGLYTLDQGDVYYNDISLSNNFEKAISEVGFLIENPSLYDNLSGLNNLKLFSRLYKNVSIDRIKEVIDMVNLNNDINRKFKTYSLGMKERLAIAQSLLGNPSILILDEPTNGLDPIGIKKLRNLIKNMNDVSVIISSHLLSEIESLCDEVIFINEGKIIERRILSEENKMYAVFDVDDYNKAKMLLGEYCVGEEICVYGNEEEVSEINKYLINNNINVYGIVRKKKSLAEDFFEKINHD